MSDRELLELAAKAADIFLTPESLARAFPKWKWDKDFELRHEGNFGVSGAVLVYDYDGKLSGTTRKAWNPLTDDGDALRLACDLGLRVYPIARTLSGAACSAVGSVACERLSEVADLSLDTRAATRRAIVRAAAEIGRQMP